MVISKYFNIIDESKRHQDRSLFKYRLFILDDYHMQISDERKKRVIDLYFNQHKTYAEIAEIEKMSLRDINSIIKEEQARRQQYRHQQQQEKRSSKAYKLFSAGNRLVQVAIILNLRELDATKLYREYWRLKRMDILNLIYKETNGKLGPFLKLYRLIKE